MEAGAFLDHHTSTIMLTTRTRAQYSLRMRTIWMVTLACFALGTTADAKRLHLHRPRRGFQMHMTHFVIPPASEREGCEYRVTPNRRAMDVQSLELNATAGTHHFVLWEYLGKDDNPADFWSGIKYAAGCIGLGPQDSFGATANLFGMQASHARVEFPPGIAVRLEPHATVYPNLHVRNPSLTDPLTGEAVFNLIPARKGTVRHHAQALVVGSFQIDIPPQSSASLAAVWYAPANLNLVQLSTHEHHRGTLVSSHQVDATGTDMGELVLSTDWQHPTERWFPVAQRVLAGEGIRFTCEWSNPDDHPVHFGVTTDDEMCFVTGYFYPDDDSARVTGPGCVPQGAGLECFVPKLL